MNFEKTALDGIPRLFDATLQVSDCPSFLNITSRVPKIELEQTLSGQLNYHRDRVWRETSQ